MKKEEIELIDILTQLEVGKISADHALSIIEDMTVSKSRYVSLAKLYNDLLLDNCD